MYIFTTISGIYRIRLRSDKLSHVQSCFFSRHVQACFTRCCRKKRIDDSSRNIFLEVYVRVLEHSKTKFLNDRWKFSSSRSITCNNLDKRRILANERNATFVRQPNRGCLFFSVYELRDVIRIFCGTTFFQKRKEEKKKKKKRGENENRCGFEIRGETDGMHLQNTCCSNSAVCRNVLLLRFSLVGTLGEQLSFD